MLKLTSKPSLIHALTRAAARKLEVGEIDRQRVSFIMSALEDDSDATRARVKELLVVETVTQHK